MALLRLIVVVAFFLLGAWASQATAHNNVNNDNPKPAAPKRRDNSNNGETHQFTQVADPPVDFFPNTNLVDTTNKLVEKTTETMAEPPQLSGTCDGNHRALGGWLAVIIAVSLYYHHRL
nr:uncharacterized protein LOC109169613 [Ipomoea batatas]